ncbi:MAG TPA: LuxR C-terminal-related transcriptional regulator, partial [Variovorax sp.]
ADAFRTGVVANVLAAGCCATDAFEPGLQALAIARRAFEECGAHYGLAWASALATMIAMRRGDLSEAMAQARLGIAVVEPSLGAASYAGSMLTLLAAEICYEQGELAQAGRYLDLGLPFIDEHGLVEMSAAGYLTRARLLRQRGEPASADTCLLEGESLGHRLKLPRLARILAAERCALRLAPASLDDAFKLAQSYGFIGHGGGGSAVTAGATFAAEEDSVCLVVLRLRLAQGGGASAVGALNDALRRALRDGHQAQLARLLCLKAQQQHKAMDSAQALRTLDEALVLAARCGLLRSLLDAEPLLLDMAETICSKRLGLVPPAYLRQLLEAAGRRPAEAQAATVAPRERTEAEELTERELKILRLLKAGLGNRELAQSLFLSEATVKWHLHNIFAKLGVKNRTSALARAQEISLL